MSQIQIPQGYYTPPLTPNTNVLFQLQASVLSAYGGFNLQQLTQGPATILSQQHAPNLPFFAYHFAPKDQLMLYWLHKVLTYNHSIPAPPPYDPMDNNGASQHEHKEKLTLPAGLLNQPIPQNIDVPILDIPDDTNSRLEYNKYVDLLVKLIDLYCNTYNVSPPPTDQQIYDAMMRQFDQNNIKIEININHADYNKQMMTHQTPPVLNSLQSILTNLSQSLESYHNVPLLTTMSSPSHLSAINPSNLSLFPVSKTQIHQNQQKSSILTVYQPMSFILPIHIPLLMILGRILMPSLGNVIQQMMTTDPNVEHTKAYRFHIAMNCIYEHLIAICTLLLTFNLPMQLDLLRLHDNTIQEQQKGIIYNNLPFIWVSSTYTVPPHVLQSTVGPNPTPITPSQYQLQQQQYHQQPQPQQPPVPNAYPQPIVAPAGVYNPHALQPAQASQPIAPGAYPFNPSAGGYNPQAAAPAGYSPYDPNTTHQHHPSGCTTHQTVTYQTTTTYQPKEKHSEEKKKKKKNHNDSCCGSCGDPDDDCCEACCVGATAACLCWCLCECLCQVLGGIQ